MADDSADAGADGDEDGWVGRWPRCEDCGQLLRRDSGNCKNPVCPGKVQDGDQR